MGYRLDIYKIEGENLKNIYYNTKLYGYHDESKFLSFMYLTSIGKLDYDQLFDYSAHNRLALNKKEFTIFCYLYNIDMNNYYEFSNEKDIFINDKIIKKELTDMVDYSDEIYIIGWC